jgi:hypothetical protein
MAKALYFLSGKHAKMIRLEIAFACFVHGSGEGKILWVPQISSPLPGGIPGKKHTGGRGTFQICRTRSECYHRKEDAVSWIITIMVKES